MKIIAYPAFKTKYKNPYNWLLYQNMPQPEATVEEFTFKKILTNKYDIIHLHWIVETITRHPNIAIAFLRSLIMLVVIEWAKIQGTKVILTIHDEKPHSLLHPQLANWFQNRLIKKIDGLISLSEYSKKLIEKTLPALNSIPHLVIPHGHYQDVYPKDISLEQARLQIGVPANKKVILFFGYIDLYKNVPHLIKVFRQLSPPDWVLVIAGNIERDYLRNEIISATDNDEQIKLFLQYIPDIEIHQYFQLTDLVILPFTEILNSGSALLALSFNCPILVPNLGSIPELKEIVGENWVNLYSGELTPEKLNLALDWTHKTKRSSSVPLEQLSWKKISRETFNFYQQCL